MTRDIEEYAPITGRMIKENGSVVNIADLIDPPTTAVDYSGSTSATPNEVTTITFDPASRALHFRNTDAAKTILVSFDGGTTWVSLAAAKEIGLDIVRTSIKVKCTEASATYMCVVLS